MIHVDKKKIPAPKILSNKNGRGRKETARAIKFYQIAHNFDNGIPFKYSVYKDPEVKKELKDLFKGKCAYCEGKIRVVSTGDVEHFRPKGGFGEDKKNLTQPGYYWLGASWKNLLLACGNCNRKNRFEIVNEGVQTVGKLNKFPLKKNKARLRRPLDDFDAEETVRLLINPCEEDPSQYIEFNDDGLILPKKSGRGVSRKGKVSIQVFALQRKDLVDDRKQIIIKIKSKIKTVERCIKLQDQYGVGNNATIDQMLQDEINSLKSYLNSEMEYLAVARQLINPFIGNII